MLTVNQNVGRLDRRITLRYPVEARDTDGAVLKAWGALAAQWASFTPNSGRERFAAQALFGEAEAVFRIRHRSGPSAAWRIIHDGAIYEIIAPPVEIGRREYLDLPARAIEAPDLVVTDPATQAQTVDLDIDDEEKVITFASPFASVPTGIYCQVIRPDGGQGFGCTPAAPTTTGVTVALHGLVPSAGYKLSIIAIL